VLLTVFTPAGEVRLADKLDARGGVFEYVFNLGEAQAGEWTVVARCSTIIEERTFTVFATDVHDQAILGQPLLKDIEGKELSGEGLRAENNIFITADLISDEKDLQLPYVFIVQIINEEGLAEKISFISGDLPGGQTANLLVQWIPAEGGKYSVEILVWNSLNNPVSLVEKSTSEFVIAS
jgi:hypothetical protein